MRARRGQVALYLVMALLVITVLMLVNLNAFLAVRSKNRMMNAADMAAIAAARCQGELLNEIGRLNVEHLRAAVLGEAWVDEEGNDRRGELLRLSLFGPITALDRANAAAREWGFEESGSTHSLYGFRDHLSEIRTNQELYPDDGSHLWQAYAAALEQALGGTPAVLPGYMEMVNPGATGLFASSAFYDALSAKAWCWFSIGGRRRYLEMDPSIQEAPTLVPVESPVNSEVFSLHVTYKGWLDSAWRDEYVEGQGFTERWTNFVCRVTGLTPADFTLRSTADDPDQVWAFYDDNWGTWSTTFNPDAYPIAGTVRPEYDVAGCVASCMMLGHIQQLRRDDWTESVRETLVTAEAKPLGTVEDLDDGSAAPVTSYGRFIATPRADGRIFTEAQLVLMGAVPRSPGVSMAPDWYEHVRRHSPQNLAAGCAHCALWRQWEHLRKSAADWLQRNEGSCQLPKGDKGRLLKGGYDYAH